MQRIYFVTTTTITKRSVLNAGVFTHEFGVARFPQSTDAMIQRGLAAKVAELYGALPDALSLVSGSWLEGGTVAARIGPDANAPN